MSMYFRVGNCESFHLHKSLPKFVQQTPKSGLAHYVINQQGEKVVVSKRNNVRTKREEWQNVRPMGKEKELKKIRSIERNDRLHCDPDDARQTALNKFQELSDRLHSSGFCRDLKSYYPPDNTDQIIDNICKEFFQQNRPQDSFDTIVFADLAQKFKFLVRCHEEFGHEVRNCNLYQLNSVQDVRNYYQTPVIGTSKYDSLAYRSLDNLPPNLHVIADPIRFNPKNDPLFNGISAFPGAQQELTGLRARKKYPKYDDRFIWPDV